MVSSSVPQHTFPHRMIHPSYSWQGPSGSPDVQRLGCIVWGSTSFGTWSPATETFQSKTTTDGDRLPFLSPQPCVCPSQGGKIILISWESSSPHLPFALCTHKETNKQKDNLILRGQKVILSSQPDLKHLQKLQFYHRKR